MAGLLELKLAGGVIHCMNLDKLSFLILVLIVDFFRDHDTVVFLRGNISEDRKNRCVIL